jgi:hemerythrin-like metal-binding protein
MRPLAFTDKLKCGDAVIDSQHRRMVHIVNELLGAALDGKLGEAEDRLLDELVRLAEINFRTEEEWMRRCSYERYEMHAEAHAHLLNELVELRAGLFTRHEHLNRKVVLFVRRWLENHLVHSDRDLAESIRLCLKADAKADSRSRKGSGHIAAKRVT